VKGVQRVGHRQSLEIHGTYEVQVLNVANNIELSGVFAVVAEGNSPNADLTGERHPDKCVYDLKCLTMEATCFKKQSSPTGRG
jgi:hypothetical protein